MTSRQHWENVYATRPIDEVSWFQRHAASSLRLIHETGVARSAPIIDIGGGASVLVDELLADGYSDVCVLDLSATALARARSRLDSRAAGVRWIEADVVAAPLPANAYEIWHDRAAFHFLTTENERDAYRRSAARAIKPGGHLIIATFAEDGPEHCSGLPVARYDAQTLRSAVGDEFAFTHHEYELHRTPRGATQRFLLASFRKIAP